jgi:hypothetical protein
VKRTQAEKEHQIQLLKQETEEKLAHNSFLRYNEKIFLNKKGHTPEFKSITRSKRNHVPDGKGLPWETTPCVGHY